MTSLSHIENLRQIIEKQYAHHQLGSGVVGGCFGSILCHELHCGNDPIPAGLHFSALAEKWGVSLPILGELIWDHCKRLESLPVVKFDSTPNFRNPNMDTRNEPVNQLDKVDGFKASPDYLSYCWGLDRAAQIVRYYLKHQNQPSAWERMSEYEKGVQITAENLVQIILEESRLPESESRFCEVFKTDQIDAAFGHPDNNFF